MYSANNTFSNSDNLLSELSLYMLVLSYIIHNPAQNTAQRVCTCCKEQLDVAYYLLNWKIVRSIKSITNSIAVVSNVAS